LEIEAAGGAAGHAALEKLLAGKLAQSPGKIGGCHAMAPSCAAENGAIAAGAMGRGLMNGSVQSSGYGPPSGPLRGHPGLGHHALFGSNGGSIGIGAPACVENEKGPREGAFGWLRVREARGCAADARVSGVGLLVY
jgi:hypothetical protein